MNEKRDYLSNTVAAVTFSLGIGMLIPVAALQAAEDSHEQVQKDDENASRVELAPNSESARVLFQRWIAHSRQNGKIPGGRLRSLAKATSNFVNYNPSDERAPKLAELLQRMDLTRDWTRQEAVTLLDDVTEVYDSLPTWATEVSRFTIADDIRAGKRLPDDLKDAPWGKPHKSGLRVAWMLWPTKKWYHLNTALKSRILYHNTGDESVVFRIVTWNQSGAHQASDVTGAKIAIRATSWTTIGQVMACRLAPGEFTEVVGAGIGVGPNKDPEDWRNTRVGAWIHAKPGDEVTFIPDSITVSGKDGRKQEVADAIWWEAFIKSRLERDAPVPDDVDERKRMLHRAVQDLFGTPPTAGETHEFVTDKSADALQTLARRLSRRAGTVPISGMLPSATIKFRVLAADYDEKDQPRLAIGPGRYELGNGVRLVIVGRGHVMDAKLEFTTDGALDPYVVRLPNGYGTWAIAWKRDMHVIWAAEKERLWSIDFTNTWQVKETNVDLADTSKVPPAFLKALQPTLGAFRPSGNDKD